MTLFFICISMLLLTGLVVFWASQYIKINFPLWFIITGISSLTAVILDYYKPFSGFIYNSDSGLYFSIVLFLAVIACIEIFRYFYEHRGFGKGKNLMRRLPDSQSRKGQKQCLLTFDDGPSADWTPGILGVLKDNGIYAVFFLVGKHVEQNPEIAGHIKESGCEAAVHSHNHKPLPFLISGDLKAEIEMNFEAVEKAVGKRPRFFRPPWGLYNREVLETAESLGLQTILWSRSSIDWKEKKVEAILSNALKKVEPGEIFLFHDGCKAGATRQATLEAMPLFVKKLYDMGFIFNSFYDIKN